MLRSALCIHFWKKKRASLTNKPNGAIEYHICCLDELAGFLCVLHEIIMIIDWCVPSDTILRQPAELYLSVYSIVITFVASGNVADFRAYYPKYHDYKWYKPCDLILLLRCTILMQCRYIRYIRYIKQFWVHIRPIRIPGGLQWYLVQWTYSAQYSRPVLSSCGHPLICCLSLISNH